MYIASLPCVPTLSSYFIFFFFNDTATTEIYTLSLHDALPISGGRARRDGGRRARRRARARGRSRDRDRRSEEHTSELQSRLHLVCRLLLEKKKKNTRTYQIELPNTLQRSSSL